MLSVPDCLSSTRDTFGVSSALKVLKLDAEAKAPPPVPPSCAEAEPPPADDPDGTGPPGPVTAGAETVPPAGAAPGGAPPLPLPEDDEPAGATAWLADWL
mgnify:CR=1 FL=1